MAASIASGFVVRSIYPANDGLARYQPIERCRAVAARKNGSDERRSRSLDSPVTVGVSRGSARQMLLAAYFRNVGAVLLALVLIADFYLPTAPVVQKVAAYRPVIRIYSERKGLEPVIFDTTQVVFAAVTPAPWDRNPPAAHEIPTNDVDASGVRDAFALHSHRAASVEKGRQPTRKYAARGARTHAHAQSQIVLAARQGQFGWFGFRYW
jgi:hypothetical protein